MSMRYSRANSGETNVVSSQGGKNDVIIYKAQSASIRKLTLDTHTLAWHESEES